MKRFLAMILTLAVLVGGSYVFASTAGSASDPLVSLSYLVDTVKAAVLKTAEEKIDEEIGGLMSDYTDRLELSANFNTSDHDFAGQFLELGLQEGGTVVLGATSCFMLTEGKAVVTVTQGELIDITTAEPVKDRTQIKLYHKYFATEDTEAVFRVYSTTAVGHVDGYYTAKEPTPFAPEEMFPDMFGHWANEYVTELYTLGIVDGVDTHRFNPDGKVTRGMLVTILGRVNGVQPSMYWETGFADVDINEWYGPYVAWARQCGLVDGFEDGSFRPKDNITREQMALIFTRFASYIGASLTEGEAIAFADQDKISSWAADAVVYAQKTGLINGKDGNRFDPRGTASRAEMCTVTSRFIRNARRG